MNLRLCGIAITFVTVFVCGPAAATARLSGAVEAIASQGACNNVKQVQANTPSANRDTLELHAFTACNGESASADLHAEAATGTIGIKGMASGKSQAAGQVSLNDYWLFTVPADTAPESYISIPVSIKLDGTILPGSIMDGSFLAYHFAIVDAYSSIPTGLIRNGYIAATGDFSQTFSGNLILFYWGPNSLSTTKAEVGMQLSLYPFQGTVDFYNTASISLTLPPGVSATTSSGVPLDFHAPTPNPVPEPAIIPLVIAGLGLIGFFSRRRETAETRNAFTFQDTQIPTEAI
jgi:hypothetical protein